MPKTFNIDEFNQLEGKELFEYIQKTNLPLTTGKTQIKQAERNIIRKRITDTVSKLLEDTYNVSGLWTAEGFILEIQSDQRGVLAVELGIKIKNLDFDIDEFITFETD